MTSLSTAHTQKPTQPLVSFIIPVYNMPTDLLRECINSILRLSLHHDEREIIVVDDGSTESPLDTLADLRDLIVYVRTANQGVSVARNTGIRMAQGSFIQFVDADDLLLFTPYEHVIDLVRFSEVDMVMFDFTDKPDEDGSYNDRGPLAGTQLMHKDNIHGSAWGYMFRRSMMGSLRFSPGTSYGEDEEFTAQLLLRAERVITTTAKAYYYRVRPRSAINRSDMRSIITRLNDTRQVICHLYEKAATLPLTARQALRRRVAQLTMDYIYNIIVLTQNRHFLDRRLDELKRIGLFPLPDQDYTTKYKWFRRMTNSSMGLTVLMRALPLLNRER